MPDIHLFKFFEWPPRWTVFFYNTASHGLPHSPTVLQWYSYYYILTFLEIYTTVATHKYYHTIRFSVIAQTLLQVVAPYTDPYPEKHVDNFII